MGWLDRVPEVGNLYIGGLFSLNRREAVKEANLTHVVSVLRYAIEENLTRPYKHLQIEVDDEEGENLLEYFPISNRFVGDALVTGGNVFVHCAMGKSRSATIVIAYMMHKLGLSPQAALEKLRESRGVCEPNPGFMRQLELYYAMGTPDDVENHPMYQRWLYQQVLDESRALQQAPNASQIRFEDEHAQSPRQLKQNSSLELKCRKCRRSLADSRFLVAHTPQEKPNKKSAATIPVAPSACAHYFVDALSWMRPELEQGKLEGRFECPKCKTNVGKYAWQGMQCSCGDWVVPGLSLSRSRVEEASVATAAAGIRMPPGSKPDRTPSGQGNL